MSNQKEIPLTQNMAALVDAGLFDWLNQWKWYAKTNGATFYAARNVGRNPQKTIFMHQVVLPTEPGYTPDHINMNGLDNRRINLRPATRHQQQGNYRKRAGCTSRFKGVSRVYGYRKPWAAYIDRTGQMCNLGRYATEEEAGRAYDIAAREYFGEFARLNFPETDAIRA